MSTEKGTDGLPHVFELRVRRLVFFCRAFGGGLMVDDGKRGT